MLQKMYRKYDKLSVFSHILRKKKKKKKKKKNFCVWQFPIKNVQWLFNVMKAIKSTKLTESIAKE